jgi:serine/threonine protein kinase
MNRQTQFHFLPLLFLGFPGLLGQTLSQIAFAGKDDLATLKLKAAFNPRFKSGTLAALLDPESQPPSHSTLSGTYGKNYFPLIQLLARDTRTPASDIDRDLMKWSLSNSLGLLPRHLSEFLTHIYPFRGASPGHSWLIEFNHIQILAEAAFIFDEDGVFERQDPAEVVADASKLWHLTGKDGVTWAGAYKTVYRVKVTNDPREKEYALIRVKPPSNEDEQDLYDAARQEARVFIEISQVSDGKYSHGILPMSWIDVKSPSSRILFLAPFFNRGDAFNRARQNGTIKHITPFHEQLSVADQLLQGLAFLHKNGFVHRDIKPTNILIHRDAPDKGGQLRAALADFATGYRFKGPKTEAILNEEDFIKTTASFTAPEVVERFAFRDMKIKIERQPEILSDFKDLESLKDPKAIENPETRLKIWTAIKHYHKYNADLPLRWNPAQSIFETDQAADLWSLGLSLLEISTISHGAEILNVHQWAKVADKLHPQHHEIMNVEQRQVDAVLAKLKTPPYERIVPKPLLPVLNCLLRVNPEERCTAEHALDILLREQALAPYEPGL